MPDAQIAQIKALVETARQLIQQAATMCEEATKMEDANLRETLLEAANECEEGTRSLLIINGLRRDERKSPVSNLISASTGHWGFSPSGRTLKSAPVVLARAWNLCGQTAPLGWSRLLQRQVYL